MTKICAVCGRPAVEDDSVRCAVCGALMHRSCASSDTLTDAEDNKLCPYDAMLAALDWFDAILTEYTDSLSSEQRNEVADRLRSYLDILENRKSA
ncbi:MAG: hypothetical protein QXG40_08020 [Ignisphaera sp.]